LKPTVFNLSRFQSFVENGPVAGFASSPGAALRVRAMSILNSSEFSGRISSRHRAAANSSCAGRLKALCPGAWTMIAHLPIGGFAHLLAGGFLLLFNAGLAAQDPASNERPPPLSQKEDRPKVEIAQKAGEPKEISFDDLVFEMEKGGKFERSMLTDKINQMDGSKIRIRGFIRPAFKETGISKFVFVRDNQECCFGPGAALYDCILVELAGDKTTDYTVRPITVLGTLFLKEFKGPDGNIWAVYRMKNAAVE
jgi:hypothetical protein